MSSRPAVTARDKQSRETSWLETTKIGVNAAAAISTSSHRSGRGRHQGNPAVAPESAVDVCMPPPSSRFAVRKTRSVRLRSVSRDPLLLGAILAVAAVCRPRVA
jgi:hypothetical protein